MVKEIMETNNIFNLCNLVELTKESNKLLGYYEKYTPYKKRVIHNFLSNILHKKILSEDDYTLLKSHVDKLLENIKIKNNYTVHFYLRIDTLIYIIDKVFLYSLKLDDSLLNVDKTKQDFRYKILFYLSKNILLSNYISLYNPIENIKFNVIYYINNDFYLNYFVVKGVILNNDKKAINKIILFTYNKKGDEVTILSVPYFYLLGLNIKEINIDKIGDNNIKTKIGDLINIYEDNIKETLKKHYRYDASTNIIKNNKNRNILIKSN